MEELFKQRKVELEIAAKNIIVEIHLIKLNAEAITKTLATKERQLEAIDASIRELDHIETVIKVAQAEADKVAQAEADKVAQAEADKAK